MKLKEIENNKKEKVEQEYQEALKLKEKIDVKKKTPKNATRPKKLIKVVEEVEEEEEEVVEVVKKRIPKAKSEDELYRLTNEEILRRKLYDDVKRRVMRDLFN